MRLLMTRFNIAKWLVVACGGMCQLLLVFRCGGGLRAIVPNVTTPDTATFILLSQEDNGFSRTVSTPQGYLVSGHNKQVRGRKPLKLVLIETEKVAHVKKLWVRRGRNGSDSRGFSETPPRVFRVHSEFACEAFPSVSLPNHACHPAGGVPSNSENFMCFLSARQLLRLDEGVVVSAVLAIDSIGYPTLSDPVFWRSGMVVETGAGMPYGAELHESIAANNCIVVPSMTFWAYNKACGENMYTMKTGTFAHWTVSKQNPLFSQFHFTLSRILSRLNAAGQRAVAISDSLVSRRGFPSKCHRLLLLGHVEYVTIAFRIHWHNAVMCGRPTLMGSGNTFLYAVFESDSVMMMHKLNKNLLLSHELFRTGHFYTVHNWQPWCTLGAHFKSLGYPVSRGLTLNSHYDLLRKLESLCIPAFPNITWTVGQSQCIFPLRKDDRIVKSLISSSADSKPGVLCSVISGDITEMDGVDLGPNCSFQDDTASLSTLSLQRRSGCSGYSPAVREQALSLGMSASLEVDFQIEPLFTAVGKYGDTITRAAVVFRIVGAGIAGLPIRHLAFSSTSFVECAAWIDAEGSQCFSLLLGMLSELHH